MRMDPTNPVLTSSQESYHYSADQGKEVLYQSGETKADDTSQNKLLAHFAILDPWVANPSLGDPVRDFLWPLIEIEQLESQEVGRAIIGRVDELVGESALDEEQKEKYQLFFVKMFFVLDQVFNEKPIFRRLSEAALSTSNRTSSEQSIVAQMDPEFNSLTKNRLVMPIAGHLRFFLAYLYEKVYGNEAVHQMSALLSASNEDNTMGIKNGLSLLVTESAREKMQPKFDQAVQRARQTEDWENRNFMSSIMEFLNSEDASHISAFVSRILFIINQFEMDKGEQLGADDVVEIYEAAINLFFPASEELSIAEMDKLLAVLSILEEMLLEEAMMTGELVPNIADEFTAIAEQRFEENKLRFLPDASESAYNNFTSLAAGYFRRIGDFVQMLSRKVREERKKLGLASKARKGLAPQDFIPFNREANGLLANMLTAVTSKQGSEWKEYYAGEPPATKPPVIARQPLQRQRPPVVRVDHRKQRNPSLLSRLRKGYENLKKKWNALPIGWKIVGGVLIVVGVGAVVVGAVAFAPSVAFTVPGITSVVLMASGGVVVVAGVSTPVVAASIRAVPEEVQSVISSDSFENDVVITEGFGYGERDPGLVTEGFGYGEQEPPKNNASSGWEQKPTQQRHSLSSANVFGERERQQNLRSDNQSLGVRPTSLPTPGSGGF